MQEEQGHTVGTRDSFRGTCVVSCRTRNCQDLQVPTRLRLLLQPDLTQPLQLLPSSQTEPPDIFTTYWCVCSLCICYFWPDHPLPEHETLLSLSGQLVFVPQMAPALSSSSDLKVNYAFSRGRSFCLSLKADIFGCEV